jgi:serine/threonine protein phosphatase PrpC
VTFQLRIAGHSEIGRVRKNNQDSGYLSPNLLVVADGMGGAAAGDLASAVAIDTIRKIDTPTSGEHMLEALSGALHRANDRIADLVDADYALEGMGTTVTGVLFDGSQFGLAHIGDSRAYLLHDSHLERLTHDHSWVQSLVDTGKINESEAAVHPHRSLLLRVLNGQPANDPDLTLVKAVAGDRLLICSDGLCGLVDDPVIEQSLRFPDIEVALRRLVEEALDEGGIDNITVILADVVESAPAVDPVVLGAASERKIPAVETLVRSETTQISEVTEGEFGAGAGSEADGPEGDPSATSPAATTRAEAPRSNHGHGDDEARYSPQPPRKRRLARPLVGLLALVLIVGAGLATGYAWTRTQFYVGAATDKVAIFQGLSESFPGVPLSHVYEVQPLAVSALPPYYQDRVRASIEVSGLTAARQTVAELAAAAKRCATQTPAPRPAPSTSVSRTLSAAPTSANSAKPTATSSARPTAASTAHPSQPASIKSSPSSTSSPRASVTPTPEVSC